MRKSKINYARLPLLVALVLTTFAGNCPPGGTIRRMNFFPAFTARPNLIQPPQAQLLLWLEGNAPGGGGASYMVVDPSGAVTIWHDWRGGTRNIAAVLGPGGPRTGTRISANITTPGGATYSAFALRCGNPTNSAVRCAYLPNSTDVPSGVLNGTPYTILAVVRRTSGRGDNYFVTTNGSGCDSVTGINCERDTALHVGWSGGTTIRLGQYADDVTFEPAPAFDGSALPLSLFVAVSGVGEGKTIALLEPTFNDGNTVLDTTPLTSSNSLYIGGTPWGILPSAPDWRFVGDIFAILIYNKVLDPAEMRDAQDYLRARYGPR